jgi:hypothetical protein
MVEINHYLVSLFLFEFSRNMDTMFSNDAHNQTKKIRKALVSESDEALRATIQNAIDHGIDYCFTHVKPYQLGVLEDHGFDVLVDSIAEDSVYVLISWAPKGPRRWIKPNYINRT